MGRPRSARHRLSLDVIELIQLRYPVTGEKSRKPATGPSSPARRRTAAAQSALRRVEWRQLLPTEQERQARQLKLTIRFEGKIRSEDKVIGRLEATMKGAVSASTRYACTAHSAGAGMTGAERPSGRASRPISSSACAASATRTS